MSYKGAQSHDSPRSHDTSRIAWAATGSAEILQVHDDRDAIQTSPDDLPVIDIRSL